MFKLALSYFKPTFFRLKWNSKQKPLIFEILSREDLCLIHRFKFFVLYTASTKGSSKKNELSWPLIKGVSSNIGFSRLLGLYSLRSSECQNSSFFEAMQPQIWGYEINKKLWWWNLWISLEIQSFTEPSLSSLHISLWGQACTELIEAFSWSFWH